MKKHFHLKHALLFNIMRMTFYQLICIGLFSAATIAHRSPAQELLNQGVTLELKNVTLNEALTKIE